MIKLLISPNSEKEVVVKNKWIATTGLSVLLLSACGVETNQNRLDAVVQKLQASGHLIDETVIDEDNPQTRRTVLNAYPEREKRSYTRKIDGRPKTYTVNETVYEVVVVAVGNCKAEYQQPKGSKSTLYFDEVVGQNGEEVDIDRNYGIENPRPDQLAQYFTDRSKEFGYCLDKPKTPTPFALSLLGKKQ